MNKTGIIKVLIAGLLIAVVAVATFNYGANQRKKASTSDPTKSSLPTVTDASKKAEDTAKANDGSAEDKADVEASDLGAPVKSNIPQGNTPATGPADNLVPVLIMGGLTGAYLVSRRRAKQNS
jgi:cytoskeletal protein RodZ